jgi:phosphoadenosine phosphosulfate reductase
MKPEEVIELAVERHGPDRLVLMCSFQKESSVLVDALLRVAPEVRIATIDTGVLFPETLEAWRSFEEHFGIEIEVHDATGPWSEATCCSDAKVNALERALHDADAWISGIRREQAPTRARARHVEWDERRERWKFNPLVDWDEADVWRRINDRGLPYHVLHDRGYDSIGCMPCTAPGRGRDGRWAGTPQLECGLHGD